MIPPSRDTLNAYRNTHNVDFMFTWDVHPVLPCRHVFILSRQGGISRAPSSREIGEQ